MNKKLGLFVIVGILMSAGVASADKGFWYSSGTSWTTYINATNTGASSTTATVEFFNEAGVSLGSTTTTLGTNATWNFGTDSIGSIVQTTLELGTRGLVIISGTAVGDVRGHITQFNSANNSGFQMRMKTAGSSDTNLDY